MNRQQRIAKNEVIAGEELIPGKIAYDFGDGFYNVDADKSDQEGNKIPLVKIAPIPSEIKTKYNVGDAVTCLRYNGNDSQIQIMGLSNITYPDETICDFSTVPVEDGIIYLCCPDENKIKQYSISGTAGVDINTNWNAEWNIAAGVNYLYCAYCAAYVFFKIKTDGTEDTTITSQTRYYNSYGLAMDNAETYLYQIDGISNCIARITIADGTIDDTWTDFNSEFEDVINATDLCGNSSYLFVVGNAYVSGGRVVIRIFDYSGNFIREISIYSANTYKITADETNIYLYSVSDEYFLDTTVEIYTVTGTFVRRISENGIQAVAVKDGKIYIVTEESEGGAT